MPAAAYNGWIKVVFLLVLIVPAIGVPLLLSEREKWRDVTTGSSCQDRVYYLAKAMERYHEVHGHYPPAYVIGPDGKPWHSWRILLLREMSPGEAKNVQDYRFDEPWNGPNNSKLHSQMPDVFLACPGERDNRANGHTNYFVVVGPNTAFPGAKSTKKSDFMRPLEDTILVVEAAGQEICWLEPRDLSFDDMSFVLNDPNGKSISAKKHTRIMAAKANGSTGPISLNDLTPIELRSMLLIRPELPSHK